MDASDVRGLADQLFAALNTRDPERIAVMYAPDYLGEDVGQPGAERGREAVARTYRRLLSAFPDAQFSGETLVAGERVALIWTLRGTHLGTFLKVPPTGREVELRGVSILAVADGQIVRGQRIWDVAGFLRAVRLLPDLPTG